MISDPYAIATCDKCGDTLEVADSENGDAERHLRQAGWLVTRDTHYCNECKASQSEEEEEEA